MLSTIVLWTPLLLLSQCTEAHFRLTVCWPGHSQQNTAVPKPSWVNGWMKPSPVGRTRLRPRSGLKFMASTSSLHSRDSERHSSVFMARMCLCTEHRPLLISLLDRVNFRIPTLTNKRLISIRNSYLDLPTAHRCRYSWGLGLLNHCTFTPATQFRLNTVILVTD